MNDKARKILNEALKLPTKVRGDMASALIASLEEPGDLAPDGPSRAEVNRRIQDLDSGAVKTIPWSKARRVIRRLAAR